MSDHAQMSMRRYYVNGGAGVLVSGLVWVAAAIAAIELGYSIGMMMLFFGGMLIVPVSGIIEKLLRGDVGSPDKGMVRLAMLTLPILFGGLFLGYLLSSREPPLFFEVVAIAIGVRYLIFARVYGLSAFIALGCTLIAIGAAAQLMALTVFVVPAAVGVVEIAFGLALLFSKRA